MAEDKAEKKEEAPAGPKMILGLPLPKFIFLASNVLVTFGCLGFIINASLIYKKPAITETVARTEITKKEERKKLNAGDGFFPTAYPEMIVTLRGTPGSKSHFATIETTLVCGSEECQAQVEANKAKVEDAIQTVVSSRSFTELSSLEVKFRVKNEILNKVNAFLVDTAAVDVLFTAFVLQ